MEDIQASKRRVFVWCGNLFRRKSRYGQSTRVKMLHATAMVQRIHASEIDDAVTMRSEDLGSKRSKCLMVVIIMTKRRQASNVRTLSRRLFTRFNMSSIHTTHDRNVHMIVWIAALSIPPPAITVNLFSGLLHHDNFTLTLFIPAIPSTHCSLFSLC